MTTGKNKPGNQGQGSGSHSPEPPAMMAYVSVMSTFASGDLQWNDNTTQWEPIDAKYVGKRVSDCTAGYFCRFTPPEGHREVTDPEAVLEFDCQVWAPGMLHNWQTLGEVVKTPTTLKEVAQLLEQSPEQLRVCVPELPSKIDSNEIALIPYSRQLNPGESLRRGDKQVTREVAQWHDVPETAFGKNILQSEKDAGTRYCRAVSREHQQWWVNLQAENPRSGSGTIKKPFGSLEYACERIEAAFAREHKAPFGILTEVRGMDLLAYDLPEPVARKDVRGETINQKQQRWQQERETPKPTDLLERVGGNEEQLHLLATNMLPQDYRLFYADEEARDGDLVLTWPPHDSPRWNNVPPELFGATSSPAALMARKNAVQDAGQLQRQTKLKAARKALQKALQLLEELEEER